MNYNTQDNWLKAFENPSSDTLGKTNASFNKFLNNLDVNNKTNIILDVGVSGDYGTLGEGKPGKKLPIIHLTLHIFGSFISTLDIDK